MPPQIEIRGRTYIPIQEAARLSGLSKEYIGRLARRDVLVGQIIAGQWFIDQERLRAFAAERAKKRSTKP